MQAPFGSVASILAERAAQLNDEVVKPFTFKQTRLLWSAAIHRRFLCFRRLVRPPENSLTSFAWKEDKESENDFPHSKGCFLQD